MNTDNPLDEHKRDRLIALGLALLGLLWAFTVWLSLTSGVSEHWPPTTLDW